MQDRIAESKSCDSQIVNAAISSPKAGRTVSINNTNGIATETARDLFPESIIFVTALLEGLHSEFNRRLIVAMAAYLIHLLIDGVAQ